MILKFRIAFGSDVAWWNWYYTTRDRFDGHHPKKPALVRVSRKNLLRLTSTWALKNAIYFHTKDS